MISEDERMTERVLTLDEIENYRIFLIEEEKSEATIQKYIRDIKKFYMFLNKDKLLNKQKLIDYKNHLLESYKETSINSILISIHGFLKFIGFKECEVKLLKIQKKSFIENNKELTKDEYRRLLEAAHQKKNERLYMLLQTICTTGIRVSEHKYVTVEALKEKKAIINNKGKVRCIFFPKKLRKQLLDYCKANKIRSGSVFVTKSGKTLDRSNIWKDMKNLCDDANVDKTKVFPHNLRHLFAFTFYSVEKDLVRLADILGHSSIETTRIYTMTSMDECEKTFSKLELSGLLC